MSTAVRKKPDEKDRPRFGLCGSTSKTLTRTGCCGNLICDDEDDHTPFLMPATAAAETTDDDTWMEWKWQIPARLQLGVAIGRNASG